MLVFMASQRLKPFIDKGLEARALNPLQYENQAKKTPLGMTASGRRIETKVRG